MTSHLGMLTTTQLSGFAGTQLAELTATEFATLTTAQLGTITHSQLQAMTSEQLSLLDDAQLNSLMTSSMSGMTSTELFSLTTAGMSSLTSTQLGDGWTTSQVGGETTTQLGGQTTTQLGGQTNTQLGGQTTTQLDGQTTTQLGGQTTTQLGGQTISQLGGQTSIQISGNTVTGPTNLLVSSVDGNVNSAITPGTNVVVTDTLTMFALKRLDAANGTGSITYSKISGSHNELTDPRNPALNPGVDVFVTNVSARTLEVDLRDLSSGTVTYSVSDGVADLLQYASRLQNAISVEPSSASIEEIAALKAVFHTVVVHNIWDTAENLIANVGGFVTPGLYYRITTPTSVADYLAVQQLTGVGWAHAETIIDTAENFVAALDDDIRASIWQVTGPLSIAAYEALEGRGLRYDTLTGTADELILDATTAHVGVRWLPNVNVIVSGPITDEQINILNYYNGSGSITSDTGEELAGPDTPASPLQTSHLGSFTSGQLGGESTNTQLAPSSGGGGGGGNNQAAGLGRFAADAFSSTELANLSVDQFSEMVSTQMRGMSLGQLQSLTSTVVAAMTTSQLSGLTSAQLARIEAPFLNALSRTAIANLTSMQMGGLASTQLAALNTTTLSALTAAQVTGLSAVQLARVGLTFLGSLSTTALAGLTAEQLGSALLKPVVDGGTALRTPPSQLADTRRASSAPTVNQTQLAASLLAWTAGTRESTQSAFTSVDLAALSTTQFGPLG